MFSDVVWVAIVASAPPTITAVAGLIISLKNATKIEQVHLATNSMKDALVSATRSDALQEGRTVGIAEGRASAIDQLSSPKGP